MNSHQTVLWYMEEIGCLDRFLHELKRRDRGEGIRYGQAFYNALPEPEARRLNGSLYDPFYTDEPFACWLAISEVLTK